MYSQTSVNALTMQSSRSSPFREVVGLESWNIIKLVLYVRSNNLIDIWERLICGCSLLDGVYCIDKCLYIYKIYVMVNKKEIRTKVVDASGHFTHSWSETVPRWWRH